MPGLCSAGDRTWSLVFARQACYQKSPLPRTVLPVLHLAGSVPLTAHPSQGLQWPALPSPASFPSRPAVCVGAAWPACLWLRPRCRLAHGPIPPPTSKLGRQENTRHSCAKVAAGGQAAGGGGLRGGPRTFGGLWTRQTLQLEGHMFALVLVGVRVLRALSTHPPGLGQGQAHGGAGEGCRRSTPPGL